MYSDKDFQNRSMNKNKEETTGIKTTNISGRGVAD